MKRKIMSLLTASVLALGGSVAVAAPATAAADCPVGYSCQWGNHESAYYYDLSGYVGYAFLLKKGTGDSDLGNSEGLAPDGYNDRLGAGRFSSASLDCE